MCGVRSYRKGTGAPAGFGYIAIKASAADIEAGRPHLDLAFDTGLERCGGGGGDGDGAEERNKKEQIHMLNLAVQKAATLPA